MHVLKDAFRLFDTTYLGDRRISSALLVVRLSVGIFFLTHGYGKLFGSAPGLEGFTGMLAGMGFPLAGVLAVLVGAAEFFGGIAVILGILTRFSAFWFSVITIVAWAMVKGFSLGMVTMMPNGTPMGGGDIDLLALGLALALFLGGPGHYSLSAMRGKKHTKRDQGPQEEHHAQPSQL